jgi:hypothetical protein
METPERGSGRFARRAAPRVPSPHWRSSAIVMAVSALLVPALAMTSTTAAAATAATASAGPTPRDWVAKSAYGVQLSIPPSWKTAYFQNCPYRGAGGTLLIGTTSAIDFCTEYPESTNIVTMQPTGLTAVRGARKHELVVHGLHVTSSSKDGSTIWAVRSGAVVLTATGPRSLAILRTLSVATSRARPAPGILKGSLYLIALSKVPVTSLVSVTRLDAHGPPLPAIHSYDGQFSATLPPGEYRLNGHDGNAPCPQLVVRVRSGLTATAPSINCQGE